MLVAFAGFLLAVPALARSATQIPLTLDGIYGHNSAQALDVSGCDGEHVITPVTQTLTVFQNQAILLDRSPSPARVSQHN
jgi:hypothetical protein